MLVVRLTGCGSDAAPRPAPPEPTATQPTATGVVAVGDSLMVQATPYLQPLIGQRTFVADVFGGTAPCDWLAKDLQVTPGSVVVISFDGNSSTPCMGDGAGGYLSGQAVVDKYRTDITSLITLAHAASAVVLLVGQPVHADSVPGNETVAGLNDMYTALVHEPDVAFVDAGAAVETADGGFAMSLPCLPGEAECDPVGVQRDSQRRRTASLPRLAAAWPMHGLCVGSVPFRERDRPDDRHDVIRFWSAQLAGRLRPA